MHSDALLSNGVFRASIIRVLSVARDTRVSATGPSLFFAHKHELDDVIEPKA